MSWRVTILGSSSAKPTPRKHHAAHALNVREQFYLIDCGEGTQRRLMQAGISPLRINAVLISHLHGDHVYGLMPLVSTMGLLGRRTPLEVYGPDPLGEVIASHFRFFDAQLPFRVEFHSVDPTKHRMVIETAAMEVWSLPLRHRVPCSGYLFREKMPGLNIRKEAIERYELGIARIAAAKRGEDVVLDDGTVIPNHTLTYRPHRPRSYAYCSDTQYSLRVARMIEGVDLLYHEATFAHADRALARQTGHSTTLQAAKAAAVAQAGRLLIGHFSSRYKDDQALLDEARSAFRCTFLAEEGKTFDIPKIVTDH